MRFRFATHALAAAILFAAAPVIAQIRSAQPPARPPSATISGCSTSRCRRW